VYRQSFLFHWLTHLQVHWIDHHIRNRNGDI
jgi:hypothetical protein